MASQVHETPTAVRDLVEMGCRMVQQGVGVAPDYTPDTLPLVDEYLRRLPPGMSDESRALVVAAVGCYFGEVARRALHGRWGGAGITPEGWRIELSSCFLHFSPVGMAGEVLEGAKSDEWDGSFATLDELQEDLHTMLAQAPPVPEDEYYSLSCRVEVLQLAADWLVGKRLATGKPARVYSSEDYRRVLDS